jgi:LacI family transcriptional regulator
VSKVLRNAYGVSPELRAKVEAAIATLHYRPRVSARGMRGSTFTIGLSTPPLGDNPFIGVVIDGISTVLVRSGYDVIVLPVLGAVGGDEGLQRLVDRQVDGIIAIGTTASPAALDAVAAGTPLVAVGRHEESGAYDCVHSDDRAGVRLALDHLLALGHRRILHATLSEADLAAGEADGHAIRLRAYEERMAAEGLDALVARVGMRDAEQTFVEALADGATAVLAGNDALALEALAATRVPGHRAVAVVGYDGTPIAAHPMIGLTTVDQHGTELGARAAALLLERVKDGRSQAVHEPLVPTLRVRTSSTPPAS